MTEAGTSGRGNSLSQRWDLVMGRGRKPHTAWQAGPLHAAAWPVFETHSWTAQKHRDLFQAAGPSSNDSIFPPQRGHSVQSFAAVFS